MAEENKGTQIQDTLNEISIKDIYYIVLANWKWFALSATVALIFGVFYLLSTPNVYTRNAQVVIKNDKQGASAAIGSEFSNMGFLQGQSSVNNEIHAFQSKDYIRDAVERLALDVTYTMDGMFHPIDLYGKTLPLRASFEDLTANDAASFDITVEKDGKTITLTNFVLNNDKFKKSENIVGKLNDTIATPVGALVITPMVRTYENIKFPLHIRKNTLNGATSKFMSELSTSLLDKQADIITLTVNDISIQRGDDLLNALIEVYNEHWIDDKNQVARSTSNFIDERLAVIERELSNVDVDISSFKSANMLPDVNAAANLYMNQSSAISQQILDLNNQMTMARYIREYLTDDSKKSELIPSNTGLSSGVESQINEYNETMLQRIKLVSHSSSKNSLVVSMDRSLENIRQAIIASIDNLIHSLNTQISNLQQNERKMNTRIADNPNQARRLLSVERQQTVKEALYLFLLQKREENELSQAFTAYNTRILQAPTGTGHPTSPKRSMVLMVALIMGLAVPAGIIFIKEAMNTTVRGRKDLERLTIPFIGEIPFHGIEPNKINIKKKMKKASKTDEKYRIVVAPGKRDISNEAFRVLRTNIEFLANPDGCTTFQYTSFNAGSGKSYICMNLGICLALKEKKVLLIDGDLRHASLSAYMGSPKQGLSTYLNGQATNIDELIVKYNDTTLDVLPVGKIPPNPTELVGNGKLQTLINNLKSKYEYIIIDCPPVDIVADTQIIAKMVDRTLFVVRTGLMERSMIGEIQSISDTGRFNNMSLILNGTGYEKGKYYYHHGHGYGYGYGYGYSHNYYTES